jgi:hypothetical protein
MNPFQVARRLHADASLLTERQRPRLAAMFVADEHIKMEASWDTHERIVVDRRVQTSLGAPIDPISGDPFDVIVFSGIEEGRRPGQTADDASEMREPRRRGESHDGDVPGTQARPPAFPPVAERSAP